MTKEQQIKDTITQDYLNKGSLYKRILSFCMKIYHKENKEVRSKANNNYYNKIKSYKKPKSKENNKIKSYNENKLKEDIFK